MPAKLRLRDVTLCAADCVHPDLAARALTLSLAQCDFADAILFSDVAIDGPFRCETIPPLRSLADYSEFCLREMPKRTTTGFVLVAQWDGYVLDANAWSRDFLRYDYIGTPTPYYTPEGQRRWFVGNGGFSLRSRKLLDALPGLPLIPGTPEDFLICRTFRQMLERQSGIRFAPEDVAQRFSNRLAAPPTFGFHGFHNLARVWDEADVLDLVARLTPKERTDGRLFPLIATCLRDTRLDLARRLFAEARSGISRDRVRSLLAGVLNSERDADAMLATLEALGA